MLKRVQACEVCDDGNEVGEVGCSAVCSIDTFYSISKHS